MNKNIDDVPNLSKFYPAVIDKIQTFLKKTGMIICTSGDELFYVVDPWNYGDYDIYKNRRSSTIHGAVMKAYEDLNEDLGIEIARLFDEIDEKYNA